MIIPVDFANHMMNSVNGLNQAGQGINILWNAICDYIDQNAVVSCVWSAVSSSVPPVTDPLTSVMGGINTAAGRSLDQYLVGINQLTDCTSVLNMLSLAMNMATLQWLAVLPTEQGFVTSPGVAISPATIVLTPSNTTDTFMAFSKMGTDIVNGLSAFSFLPSAGLHLGVFSGVGTYIPGIH